MPDVKSGSDKSLLADWFNIFQLVQNNTVIGLEWTDAPSKKFFLKWTSHTIKCKASKNVSHKSEILSQNGKNALGN